MIDVRMKPLITLLALFVIWGLTSVEGLKLPLLQDSDECNDNDSNKEYSDINESNDGDCDYSSENCNKNKREKFSNENDRNILVQSTLDSILKFKSI
ncbi:hypothetical protein HZH68_003874 [Vespula germanica]|uniref:Uncharacterized protein n=1 Tax=Vespula germanica TaxID=30212 RepID=A0A834KMM1_VESGE|nr:hypothetical protein HZH68_003874 [Vespula germanica]